MEPQQGRSEPGRESVWDYPTPPRIEAFNGHVQVVFNGVTIALTQMAKRVIETGHPPVYYFPPNDVQRIHLVESPGHSWCEWRGEARYYTVVVGERRATKAAWNYPIPRPPYQAIKGHVAFFAGPMDSCLVNGEEVSPQPGGFYGGWITRNIVGPFKGESETQGW
ncbi:MAG: DUF427 domain-containing protein [Planctomycetota bacterium]|jgi:uncharacterized protein (DUF427 family)